MKYYKCCRCELNYVETEGDMCKLCKEGGGEAGVCVYCGGEAAVGEVCEICLESLSLTEFENIFIDDAQGTDYDG